jgi:hypothetical protein
VARAYLRENLRNGITTASVFCTVQRCRRRCLLRKRERSTFA